MGRTFWDVISKIRYEAWYPSVRGSADSTASNAAPAANTGASRFWLIGIVCPPIPISPLIEVGE